MSVNKRLRFLVFRRDGYACTYCGARPPAVTLHVDHEKPVASGGTDDFYNLRTACSDCNLGKGKLRATDALHDYDDDPLQVAMCDPDFFPAPVG